MKLVPVDWTRLPSELLCDIAGRLKTGDDFKAFRGICRTWRASAKKKVFTGVSKVPLLLLSKENDTSNEHQVYSFPSRRTLMTVSLAQEAGTKMCIGAGFGWFLIQTVTDEVSLLNPISGARIPLPSLADFPVYDDDAGFQPPFVLKSVLSSDPSDDPLNFALVMDANGMMLCGWRVGDETWTKYDIDDSENGFASIVFCQGICYIIVWSGDILVWDPSRKDDFNPIMYVDISLIESKLYLVESFDGNVLLVKRKLVWGGVGDRYLTNTFDVIKIDVKKRKWRKINDLENYAIFIGDNPGICIHRSSTFPDVIKPNHIYFTEDLTADGMDMGVYNLGKRVIGPRLERFVASPGFVSSSVWIDSSIVSKS